MRARRITAIITAGLLAIGGVAACGEEDVEDAARDAGNTAEDAAGEAEDEGKELLDDARDAVEE